MDQAVFKIIKIKFARIDLKLKNRLAYRNFNAIFAFLRQFALDVYITFQKSIDNLRWSAKYAQFWFGVHFPIKSLDYEKGYREEAWYLLFLVGGNVQALTSQAKH